MPGILPLFHPLRVHLVRTVTLCGLAIPPICSGAASPAATPSELPVLVVGKTTYREVHIVSHDARSVFFTYRGGIGSARLRDLSPELQAGLGYDPLDLPAEPPARPAAPVPRSPLPERIVSSNRRLEQLFRAYGTPARPAPRVSLQETFSLLDLTVKYQGARPSCAVYAIVSALEFQFFQLTGRAEDFSEEYLLWATQRRRGFAGLGGGNDETGYTLPEVATALATYGIALESEMPSGPRRTAAPDPALIELSRQRRAVLVLAVPGDTPAELLNNLVHVLNAGLPAPAGLLWANDQRSRAGWLDQQEPVGGHAVTFVGYECPTGRMEDTVFVFKNSYGPLWGQGGYGRATWRYLARNLHEACILDARPLLPTPAAVR